MPLGAGSAGNDGAVSRPVMMSFGVLFTPLSTLSPCTSYMGVGATQNQVATLFLVKLL